MTLAWAWPGPGGRGVSAIKYRSLAEGRRNEAGSNFKKGGAKVVGDPSSLDWLVAEGETDAARLVGLLGERVAILVLPAGAATFEARWAERIPRGATVHLCLDADPAGDAGAFKIAATLGGRVVRVRPSEGAKDWCEWAGGRDELLQLVREARSAGAQFRTLEEARAEYIASLSDPAERVRLGLGSIDADTRGISPGQVFLIAARSTVGKTWMLVSLTHNLMAVPEAGVLVLTLEQPVTEWYERQAGVALRLPTLEVEKLGRQGDLPERTRDLDERGRNVLLCGRPTTIERLSGRVSEARDRLEVPLRAVLIDYQGLLGASGRDPYERASKVALGLKAFAKEEHVAAVVASQLSRAGGEGTQPVTMDMLRDSGAIEESADFILGAWRPKNAPRLPGEEEETAETITTRLLKNRRGPSGREVSLTVDPQSHRIYEAAR